jgi:hypothetical protein
MKQSRLMSLVEAIANVVVGYGIAVLTQLVVFPWFGLPARVGDALAIGGIFTAMSIARSFLLRRLFETIRDRRMMSANERSASGLTSS